MLNFTDQTNQHYGFESSNKDDRYVTDHGCQTSKINFQETSVQSYKSKNAESQTDTNLPNFTNKVDESRELLLFLRKHEPIVTKILQGNLKSRAFSNYHVTWQEDLEITCQLKLSNDEMKEKMSVTSLSWNASSSVIAASFGRSDHEDCCMHTSFLCTWNIDRTRLDPKKADNSIELNSCITVVSWHPLHPSVIAGGTFNGDIKIWDLSNEMNLQASTQRTGDSHLEAVSGLKWILSGRSQQLFSIGGDGRMFLWEYNQLKGTLKALNKFFLLSECLPRQIRAKVGSQQLLSLTSCDFGRSSESSFIVGTDGGYLFHCSFLVQHSTGDGKSLITTKSPVVSSSWPHRGPVHSIHFSPYHDDIFVSASYDGTFVVHSLQQMKPLKQVHTNSASAFHAQWSPWRPGFVAVATFEGTVQFHDLSSEHALPLHEIQVSEKDPLMFVMFNSRRPGLLCAGDANGNVTVWNLNSSFYNEKKSDMDSLLKLL